IYATKQSAGYREQVSCPFLDEAKSGQVPNLFATRADLPANTRERSRPGTAKLERVATNKPSFLERSKELPTIAFIRPQCRLESEPRNNPIRGDIHFAQAKRYESGGKILVMADHSIFINQMLIPPERDNDNLEFTMNTLDWLVIGPDGQRRDRVLFIDQTGE